MSETMRVESGGDIVFLTVSKYRMFIYHGPVGVDAMLLYLHLMFTARLQQTNCVYATEKYIRNGLKWGKERLYKAKCLLYDLDLINTVRRKDEQSGKFIGTYIEVKTTTAFLEPQVSLPDSGGTTLRCQTTNALTKKGNALTNKGNITGFSGENFKLKPETIDKYANLYSNIDVIRELKELDVWLSTNPERLPKPSGIHSYVQACLRKKNDKAKSVVDDDTRRLREMAI